MATGLIRLFSLTDAARAASARAERLGERPFQRAGVARETLALYAEIARRPR